MMKDTEQAPGPIPTKSTAPKWPQWMLDRAVRVPRTEPRPDEPFKVARNAGLRICGAIEAMQVFALRRGTPEELERLRDAFVVLCGNVASLAGTIAHVRLPIHRAARYEPRSQPQLVEPGGRARIFDTCHDMVLQMGAWAAFGALCSIRAGKPFRPDAADEAPERLVRREVIDWALRPTEPTPVCPTGKALRVLHRWTKLVLPKVVAADMDWEVLRSGLRSECEVAIRALPVREPLISRAALYEQAPNLLPMAPKRRGPQIINGWENRTQKKNRLEPIKPRTGDGVEYVVGHVQWRLDALADHTGRPRVELRPTRWRIVSGGEKPAAEADHEK